MHDGGRRHRRSGGGEAAPAGGEGGAVGKRTLVEHMQPVRLKARGPSGGGAGASTGDADADVARAAGSSGAPLHGDVRAGFEASLGVDLSDVRVHTGADSAAAATSLSARAYATGRDIHFAEGAYDPGSAEGKHLVAHEVAHTVQQRGGPGVQAKLDVSTPGDSAEVEADRAADAMTSGRPFTVSQGGSQVARVQRDFETDEMHDVDVLKAAANKSTAGADWLKVARRLADFSNDHIAGYVTKRMSLGERSNTLQAATAAGKELDRVAGPIRTLDGEAARIADVYLAWDQAVAASDWKRAANQLNAMARPDMLLRLRPLTWFQKMDIQKAAGDNPRIAEAIDASEKERVAKLLSDYAKAIGGGDWPTAANLLNGMDDDGMGKRLKLLEVTKLMAIRSVATDRVAIAIDKELASPRPDDVERNAEGVPQVTHPVPIMLPLIDLPNFKGDTRTTKEARDAGPWGGSPDVKLFILQLVDVWAGRKADAQLFGAKPPTPDRGTLTSKFFTEELADLTVVWDRTIDAYQNSKDEEHFAYFARDFCSEIGQALLFKLYKGTLGNYTLPIPPGVKTDPSFEPMVAGDRGAPVKPFTNNFIRAMPKSPGVWFGNYPKHGSIGLEGAGYSLDISITDSVPDAPTGFYPREMALQVIHNIAYAASVVGGDWQVCYNDFSVAMAAKEAGYGSRISYSGVNAKTEKPTNWHGPLRLHFHLDVVPSDKPPGLPSPVGATPPSE